MQACQRICFFCEAVPSLAAQSGVVNHEFIFMPSSYSRSMAKPTGSVVAIADIIIF
jgi:hypothetical protein